MIRHIVIACLLAGNAFAQWGEDSRTMGRYLFPGGQVSTFAADAAGLNGTAGATGWTFTATSAFSTNFGTTNLIQTPLTGTLATNESCAIALWFKTSATSSNMALSGVNMGSPGTLLSLELGSGSGAFISCRDSDSSASDTCSITNELRDGNWHHICAMYDGNARQIRLYYDGAASSNASVSANSGSAAKTWTTGLGIGGLARPSAAPLRPFIGSLWDVRIMRFAPSQDEVQAIRSQGPPP